MFSRLSETSGRHIKLTALMKRFAVALVVTGLAACAGPQSTRLLEAPGTIPPSAEIVDVPFYPQEDHYCGPAAVATVLTWSGVAVTQDEIAPQVYTAAKEGSHRSDVLAATRRHGRLALQVNTLPDLLQEVAAGNPVLVFQNLSLAWWPEWHFAVAVGYDLPNEQIVLRSGLEERRVTDLSTFEHTWERGDYWALVVTAPDRLPSTADEKDVVLAAAAIERAGMAREAALAYNAISDQWPRNFAARMGLGNAYFALGHFAAAEHAFRQAVVVAPNRPDAWNNLAYALARQDRKHEAIEAAERALTLADDDAKPYLATLQEVSSL